jgi:hypothetical protein
MEAQMDDTTAKMISAMTTGQSAATAALIALLVNKGLIRTDEIVSILSEHLGTLEKTDLPESAAPVRCVLSMVLEHLEKPQSPRAH